MRSSKASNLNYLVKFLQEDLKEEKKKKDRSPWKRSITVVIISSKHIFILFEFMTLMEFGASLFLIKLRYEKVVPASGKLGLHNNWF